MIKAEIVADSINNCGSRLTTFKLTFPRFILAELNTHRAFSKNSASSRAVPFSKMVESVQNNPFIPIAWQKDHKGMQGIDYLTDVKDISDANSVWLSARDEALIQAKMLNTNENVTKQLCNRLLEPFMWHTCILTGTDFENFFNLRCPQYFDECEGIYKRSRKDISPNNEYGEYPKYFNDTLGWLQINEGQSEIHMMALAEAMWDAYQENKPEVLKIGTFHIPFREKSIFKDQPLDVQVKLSVALCARVSYTVFADEKEITVERLLSIYDKMALAEPPHSSPFEHVARAYYEKDCSKYYYNLRGFQSFRFLKENNLFLDGITL